MINYCKHLFKSRQNRIASPLYLNKRQAIYKPLLLIAPALTIIIVFTIIPFLTSTFHAFEYLPNKYDKTVTAVGTKNWTKLLDDPFFNMALKNSMLYAFISIPLVIVLAAIISAVLASVGRKWLRGAFQTIFFLPYVTSAVAIALAFAYFFDLDNGLLNKITGSRIPWLVGEIDSQYALYSMIIYGTWRGLAFNILIFTTAMLGIDKNLYKSAAIDGAGPIRQFFTITLPAINRTINFLLTIGIIGAIKVFPLALFNNNPSNAMNNGGGTLLLYVYRAVKAGDIQRAAVSSVMLLVISISFSIVFRSAIIGTIKLATYIGEKNVSNKIKVKLLMK